MKTKILLLVMALGIIGCAFSQKETIELTFTAIDSTVYKQLDSIKVMNRTQGNDTVLYWPDTTLSLDITHGDGLLYIGYSTDHQVGIQEPDKINENFQISQNYPNPVIDQTVFTIFTPKKGSVNLMITDILGRTVTITNNVLEKGIHSFRFAPNSSSEIYFITASWNGIKQSIKVLSCLLNTTGNGTLEYIGSDIMEVPQKSSSILSGVMQESGRQDAPITSDTIILQFATNTPCPGLPTIDYGGQIYNTIQVYNQCWMKENLNVGTMLLAPQMQTNNDTIEKYCMGNSGSWCSISGGLYVWDEMMDYTYETGGQGICPDGWHIPDDLDWQILEGAVDSDFKIGDTEWEYDDWRGTDAGGNLKQTGTTTWVPPNNGATDAYNFTALPGGYFVQGDFWGIGYKGYFYSSDLAEKYYRNFDWNQVLIKKGSGGGSLAISIRCVKND